MPREREAEGWKRDPTDASEALIDKLRSDDFSGAVAAAQTAANSAMEAQSQLSELCLRADGRVTRADPLSAFVAPEPPPTAEDPDEELRKIREARKKQMQEEKSWREQGHGSLMELKDEREWVEQLGPHERSLVLLDDAATDAGKACHKALTRIARAHLEAQFWSLHPERAKFLTTMVELDGFPAIFVLHKGEVTRHLPPSIIFQYSSASSPLFPSHLTKLLFIAGAITDPENDGEAEEQADSEQSEEEDSWRRRRR
eukprot:TRINITY_DN14337_c3_g8_i1.p1 TRINITY_DN14337_c3_g8~~TRINITY_DN14337_c3_g8_i1.p1  ORF type:complete len:257 (-),score=62.65 TRINITY_DN14337_c3_g8_i1:56-826(-)